VIHEAVYSTWWLSVGRSTLEGECCIGRTLSGMGAPGGGGVFEPPRYGLGKLEVEQRKSTTFSESR